MDALLDRLRDLDALRDGNTAETTLAAISSCTTSTCSAT